MLGGEKHVKSALQPIKVITDGVEGRGDVIEKIARSCESCGSKNQVLF